MQHLQFALWAVTALETDREVPRSIHRRPGIAGFRQRAQLKDIVLQLTQQRVCGRRLEPVNRLLQGRHRLDIGTVVFGQKLKVIAPLLAPGGQQRIGVLVQLVRIFNG